MEISYKIASLAKEKGYFIHQPKRYVDGELTYTPSLKYVGRRLIKPDQQQVFAPLQSELQTWLRNMHKIHI